MVYLREILKHNKDEIVQYKNIELVAYLSITSPEELKSYDFELSPEEEVAFIGYKNEQVDVDKILAIINKAPIKGLSASTNVYKLVGLYLAARDEVRNQLYEKYSTGDLKQKYFLAKAEPTLYSRLRYDIANSTEAFGIIIKRIMEFPNIDDAVLDNALQSVVTGSLDVLSQILLEDLEALLIKTSFNNKSPVELVREILNNFSNAVQKITKNRRAAHSEFQIEDEYDVQDILYVILKSVFQNLRDEDPIPKVGAKSTKIDLILREERILIEVKMIKQRDSNETHFIEQLKIDFESYHECQWLEKLFCFVYDPHKKTRDVSNFKDLNGDREKGKHRFNVEIIVTS